MSTVHSMILTQLAKEHAKKFAEYVHKRAHEIMNGYAWDVTFALEREDLDVALELTEKFTAAKKVWNATLPYREFENFADFSAMSLEEVSTAINTRLPNLKSMYESMVPTNKEE